MKSNELKQQCYLDSEDIPSQWQPLPHRTWRWEWAITRWQCQHVLNERNILLDWAKKIYLSMIKKQTNSSLYIALLKFGPHQFLLHHIHRLIYPIGRKNENGALLIQSFIFSFSLFYSTRAPSSNKVKTIMDIRSSFCHISWA